MATSQQKSLAQLKESLKIKNFASVALTIEVPPEEEVDRDTCPPPLRGAPKAADHPLGKPLDFVRPRSFGEMQTDKRKPLTSPRTSFSERVVHAASDFSVRILMPYLQYRKEKRALHTPFKWTFDEGLASHVVANSLFVIREVPFTSDTGNQAQEQYFQIQLDKERVKTLRKQIQTSFDLYYKLVFCNKIPIYYCFQINRLHRLLDEVFPHIDIERGFDYEAKGEEILLVDNIQEKVYEEYKHTLEPLVKRKFVPTLVKLKKEYYAMEYLSDQHANLKESIEFLVQDINQTIKVVSTLKKKAEMAKSFLDLDEKDTVRFEKVRKPQDLYNSFIDLAVQIKTLSDETNLFSKLRDVFRKYLKITVIMEIYASEENKLRDLKKKLILLEDQLRKKLESQKIELKAFSRRSRSLVPEIEFSVEPCRVDLKKLIIDEEFLDKPMITHMKQHVQAVERFVKRAEVFCEEATLERNQQKISKMHHDTSLYLEQVEMVIRGLTFTKQTMEKINPIVESESFGQATTEEIEKEVKKEFADVTFHINQTNWALDPEHWSSQKILSSIRAALQQEIMIKGKGAEKAVLLGRRSTLVKLAKIIRERQHEKSRIYVSCKARVEAFLNVEDTVKFFMSKKLWNAVASPKSHLVSIKDDNPDPKKHLNRRIHCNPELEAGLWKIIRSFVNALSNPEYKSLP